MGKIACMENSEFAVIDTKLANLHATIARKEAAKISILNTARRIQGERPTGQKGWSRTEDEVFGNLVRLSLTCEDRVSGNSPIVLLDMLTKVNEMIYDAQVDIDFLDAEFTRRGGWTRFFLVPGGHIHSSTTCSTCYPTTWLGWLPALSGLTEADAVATHGPLLCSVCFPDAPVEWTIRNKPAGCAGSGSIPVEGTARRTGHTTYAECSECGTRQIVTGAGVLRKHKPKA